MQRARELYERWARWFWKFRIQMGWVWCDNCRSPRLPYSLGPGKMVATRVWRCTKCVKLERHLRRLK